MNNWKLRSTITGQNGMDFVEVNGHLASLDDPEDTLVQVVPFGDKYPYYLRTSATDDFGPVSNQVPGICNGTFTHTGAASGTVDSVVIEGQGTSTPNFTYTFLADGTLSTIVAAQAGDRNIRVGDKYQITTNEGHVIQFRLVDGSNMRALSIRLIHDQGVLPYAVHKVKITETSDHTIQVLDYRSQQVFPRPQDKLLDRFPATVAYGLRKLRSAYLGPAIRVRRAADNAEKDIYFNGQGNLDTADLVAFAGGSSFIRTWYDQSGNGKDAVQTAAANQPRISQLDGSLVTVNGKPALDFDGSNDGFAINTVLLYGQDRLDAYMHYQTDEGSFIMLSDPNSTGRTSFVPQNTATSTILELDYDIDGTEPTLYVNGVKPGIVYGTTTRDELHTMVVTNAASHSNGAIVVHEAAGTQGWTDIGISSYSNFGFGGKLTEMVLYNTDQSANRENIEKDMALYSGAYQVEDAPLLDAYGGAHAAYSLRKLNSDYTGAAIRLRRTNDSEELDISFDANGNLDIAACDAFYNGSNLTVKKWYDQSGNGNDVTQSTNSAQPPLYNNNGLIPLNGRPAMRFAGNDALPFDSTGLDIGNLSSFAVVKLSTTTGIQRVIQLSGSPNRWYAPVVAGGNFQYSYGAANITPAANTNNNLHTLIAGATQGHAEAFVNGTSAGTTALSSGISVGGTIGGSGSDYLNGYIQEIVVYSSDQSERRTGIERNISNHYEL